MQYTQQYSHRISSQDYMVAFGNMYITKYITEPTMIGGLEPVAPQAISTEAINLLEIDIPRFEDTDGPIRYCKRTYGECVCICFLLQSLLHCDYQCYST